MSIMDENRALAGELCRYSRLCYDRRLVGAAGGNLSARVPNSDLVLVTGSGIALRDVSPENLVVVTIDGKIVENPSLLKPSKESSFHLAIYKAKPDVNAVIHVHPAYATVYAAAGKTIQLPTVSSKLKLKQGILIPDADPGSETLSMYVAGAVTESPANTSVLLMERHGIVTYRSNLRDAFDDAELAEDTAKISYMLSQMRPAEGFRDGRMSVIDLTAPLNDRIQCYPTDPPFSKDWHLTFEQAGVFVSKLTFGAHTGTHVDAPLHFLEKGTDVSRMPLQKFMGNALALDTPKKAGENITAEECERAEIESGDIVLFRTGWERYSGSENFFKGEWPGFTCAAIDFLVGKGVKAMGGDMASADSPQGIKEGCASHKRALSAGLPIFEGLVNLDKVVGRRFFFIGLPLNIEECEASPVRAIAVM